jgi:hypothetical protein
MEYNDPGIPQGTPSHLRTAHIYRRSSGYLNVLSLKAAAWPGKLPFKISSFGPSPPQSLPESSRFAPSDTSVRSASRCQHSFRGIM